MLREGSTLGITGDILERFTPNNAPFDESLYHVVDEHFLKRLNKGDIAGPFYAEQIEDVVGQPLRSSPMQIASSISSAGSWKHRVCDNLSYPHDEKDGVVSINFSLEANFTECTYTSVAELQREFRSYDKDVEVYGTDFVDGFHHIPVHPSVRHHLVLFWRGGFWIRKVASFGARSTPGEFGNLVDATKAILSLRFPSVRATNQVDDLAIARHGRDVSGEQIRALLSGRLGWAIHGPEKGYDWCRTFIHNGIIWDLDNFTMSITPEKQRKYYDYAGDVLAKSEKIPIEDVEKLIGYLVYVTLIAREQKTEMKNLFAWRRTYERKPRRRLHIPELAKYELRRWRAFLSQPSITHSFNYPTIYSSLSLHSDASNIGIGVVANDFANFWPFINEWRRELDAHIGPAEGWGSETLLEVAVQMGAQNCILKLGCDNTGFIGAWRRGWSSNSHQNNTIKRMNETCTMNDILIEYFYVDSKDNPADLPSRGEVPAWYQPLPFLDALEPPFGTVGGPKP
ncbi:hypothetical protein RQP46_009914 [Phenoliferia psychrophenolica]